MKININNYFMKKLYQYVFRKIFIIIFGCDIKEEKRKRKRNEMKIYFL